ncbi:MAG: 16S rRNA (cytosine(967)-C(5))-methyltransferase RsmB [Colwelliaceae bacterium]|jgi:16S rRNA (cytosine967-C5)-methyltransferase|nr:16S rRNA (cytosine(967)-C(5))-methyltransferase RsmB [Colwelliaceae bacterium]
MVANVRALAAKCTYAVIDKGRSLADELPALQTKVEGKDKGLLQELCYGVLRYLPELEHEARQLIQKPLVAKQRAIHFLILVGIYQIKYTRIPDHAAVSETVSATKPLKHQHLKALVNGILRNFQRKEVSPEDNLADAIKFNHPSWFIKKIQAGYPEHWQDVLLANQERPPMWLRVNQQHHTIDQYLKLLEEVNIDVDLIDEFSGAIKLTQATDVNKLPGFELGHVSIQDGAAQQAARLLDCQEDDNVLDCCAAPGGKTCHILELTPKIKAMTAIDIEEKRLVRVQENLARLNLKANVIAADASKPELWWDNQQYDRILLDAPCSGTGVIRRHPDIKWLRKATDINSLSVLQKQILKNIWSLLKPGGTLLYVTCSILPEENYEQIQQFISDNNDVELIDIDNTQQKIGWQILPNEQSMDGFYYAKLKKKNNG